MATKNTNTAPVEWFDNRAPYIRGSHCRTDLPEGADRLYSVEGEEISETGETMIFEIWICN